MDFHLPKEGFVALDIDLDTGGDELVNHPEVILFLLLVVKHIADFNHDIGILAVREQILQTLQVEMHIYGPLIEVDSD